MKFFFQTNTIGVILKDVLALPSLIMAIKVHPSMIKVLHMAQGG